MCYIFKENEITPILAEEDIPVLKIGHLQDGNFISINRGARYQFKQEYRIEEFWKHLRISPFEGEYMTGVGLYSIETESKAKEYLDDIIRFARHPHTFRARIFRAYIPKGSHYLKTDDGCYISDGLVVINKTLDYYPKLCKEFLELNREKVRPYVPENILKGKE